MKRLFYSISLIGFIIFISNSCKLLGSCEDEKFSTSRTLYTGSQLKINGYYYGDTIITEGRTTEVRATYFFQNGIVAFGGGELQKLSLSQSLLADTESLKKVKILWGIFRIEGTKLIIERWLPRQFDCLDAIQDEAQILNDSTYLLKRTNKIYRFRASSVKPDSTNNFIK